MGELESLESDPLMTGTGGAPTEGTGSGRIMLGQ